MQILNKDLEEFYRTARFAFYVRTSSERQEREGTAESQVSDLWHFMQKNFPWVREEDVVIYKDEGWSGTVLERPEMDRLRIDLLDDKWDVLICYDQDRIGRDTHLQLVVLNEVAAQNKKLLFCTTEAPSQSIDSKFMFEVRGLMAKYERIRSLDRFRIGKLRKARSKKILLSVPPYGYSLVKKSIDDKTGVMTDTHLVINDEEAKVVRMIFSWVGDEGMTLRQVAKRLTLTGVKPRKNKNGIWNTSTLGSLVRNKTYIGQAYYQTTQAVEPKYRLKVTNGPIKNKKTSKIMRPEEDWIIIDVPAILDTEAERQLFDRTQAQLLKNAAISPRTRKNDYLVGGLIRCSCGAARTGEGPQKGKYLYYRCGSRNYNRGKDIECKIHGVNARIADEAVWQALTKIITDPEALFKAYKNHSASKGSVYAIRIENLNKEIEQCVAKIEDLKNSFVDNKINVHDFTLLKSRVEEKEKELRQQLTKARAQVPKDIVTVPDEYLKNITGFTKKRLSKLNFDQKRGIVVRLVDNVVAVPGSLEITGHIGVSSTSAEVYGLKQEDYSSNSSENHVKLKTKCRNCWTTKCW